MSNLKAEAMKVILSEGVEKDIAKKAFARLERWMKAAYGDIDYQAYLHETGDIPAGVRPYVDEIRAGKNKVTYNSQQFGIQGTGHSSRGRRRD